MDQAASLTPDATSFASQSAALQPVPVAGAAVQRKAAPSLGNASKNERKGVQVQSNDVAVPKAKCTEYFQKLGPGRYGSTYGPVAPVSLGAGIDADHAIPLGSIASYLAWDVSFTDDIGATKKALEPNSTVTVKLDLTGRNLGTPTYRMSWVGAKGGRGGRLIIELVTSGAPRQNTSVKPSAKSELQVGKLKFPLLAGWTTPRLPALKSALDLTPKKSLEKVDGLRFAVGYSGGGKNEGGHYDPSSDTVRMKASIFGSKDVRFGNSTQAVRCIVHEIGHAIDNRPMKKAEDEWKKAGQYLGGKQYRNLMRTRTESGMRTKKKGNALAEDEQRKNTRATAFRKAVRKDGIRVKKAQKYKTDARGKKVKDGKVLRVMGAITRYGETNWQELFAESFSLYVTDPTTLKALRPATYAYFVKHHPRK